MRLALGILTVWALPPVVVLGCAASAATFGDSGAPLMVSDSHEKMDAPAADPPKGDASEPLMQRVPPPVGVDGGVDVGAAVHNCTPTTSKPNPEGIGGYCTPNGQQCTTAGPAGKGGTVCTADLPQAPPNGWFCTLPCVTAATCGTNTVCDVTPQGQECIPVACDFLVDGGFPEATPG
jgi:hypothetical protein